MFVTHLRLGPNERQRFYSPDILDVMELLDIADSSLKVVALLQRSQPAGQPMFRCDQTTCGLHRFQWSWMTARGSCRGEEACGAILKIQHAIARTLSGDVNSIPTGPEQRSRDDIAHEAMRGLKRLFKAAETQGKVAQETVKLLKDLSKGKRTSSVTSVDRTSDHSSDRAVTVRSETQKHVPYSSEDHTESQKLRLLSAPLQKGNKSRPTQRRSLRLRRVDRAPTKRTRARVQMAVPSHHTSVHRAKSSPWVTRRAQSLGRRQSRSCMGNLV